MTSDHLSVTPYYDGPQTIGAQIASLGDLKFSQKLVDKPKVILLGREVAMRTFTAEFIGTYKGQEMPRRQFVTAVLVKRGGRWVEDLSSNSPRPMIGMVPRRRARGDLLQRICSVGSERSVEAESAAKRDQSEADDVIDCQCLSQIRDREYGKNTQSDDLLNRLQLSA